MYSFAGLFWETSDSELALLIPLFSIFLLGMLPTLLFPLIGFAGLAVIGVLVIACGFGEYLRAMAEYNEHVIVRGYLARSDQGRHLSSLKSASRLAKGFTAAGVGITSIAIIGLYCNSVGFHHAGRQRAAPVFVSASASDGPSRRKIHAPWNVGDQAKSGLVLNTSFVARDPNRTSAESRASFHFHQELVRPATNATILAETEIVR